MHLVTAVALLKEISYSEVGRASNVSVNLVSTPRKSDQKKRFRGANCMPKRNSKDVSCCCFHLRQTAEAVKPAGARQSLVWKIWLS